MIPLQTTLPVKSFPRLTVFICLLFISLDLLSRIWPGEREIFLKSIALIPSEFFLEPSKGVLRTLSSALFFPHLFSMAIQTLFVWVFTPRMIERRGWVFALLCGLSGVAVSAGSFILIHPGSEAPMLVPEALIGAWLGACMRRDIWGTVNTFVIGPGWMRVLEVPSYVQIFFWFFYQLLTNLFLPPILTNAPMLYWVGFSAFIWGFLLDSIWGGLCANRTATTKDRS